MDDDQLIRYKRHLLLPKLDVAGQERLLAASVLVVGAGGLGSPVSMYLAAAGVGHIVLFDNDHVEVSNLQRQLLFDSQDLGQFKSVAAAERLKRINPSVEISAHNLRLDEAVLDREVPKVDLVIDCSDNFTTRFAVNRACVKHARKLVSGAAIRMEGQVSVFAGHQHDKPCYQCLYQPVGNDDERCTNNGILGPVVGVIGSIMAIEAIKLLARLGGSLEGRLLLFDAELLKFSELRLSKDKGCPVCGL